jgi:hypothetical protein
MRGVKIAITKRMQLLRKLASKYPLATFVVVVMLGTFVFGSLMNNVERTKQRGVIDYCGRSATVGREPQPCLADKIVKGFPVKTTITYVVVKKPTDLPPPDDIIKVRYSKKPNALADSANFLIAGGVVATIAGFIYYKASGGYVHYLASKKAKQLASQGK